MDLFRITQPLLHALDAEKAHTLAIKALASGLVPQRKSHTDTRLSQKLWGVTFPNPVGIAAGFDKNAEAFPALYKQGFGFAEVGTLTPKAQVGNPKPRVFRLREDSAVINRLGFNNRGVDDAMPRLAQERSGVLGINIGKNKTTEDALDDYVPLLGQVLPHADYVTINISSPNTEGLRDLQAKEQLQRLLGALIEKRGMDKTPLLLKIAPDISAAQAEDVCAVVMQEGFDGMIVSNTTIARPDTLASNNKAEQGGLSGAPLRDSSTQLLRHVYQLTDGALPLIGVGGIMSGQDAVEKIKAGASLVQAYTGFVYKGFGLVSEINQALSDALDQSSLEHISALVGSQKA